MSQQGIFSSIRNLIVTTATAASDVISHSADAVTSATDVARAKAASFQLESRQELLALVTELGGTEQVLADQANYEALLNKLHGRA